MAAVSRRNGSENLESTAPHERQWKPPLRQAAGTLAASGQVRSGQRRKELKINHNVRQFF
jgi:hypothetical protein